MRLVCLGATTFRMTEESARVLMQAAFEMTQTGARERSIKGPLIEGKVTTENVHAALGTYGGVVFQAEVDTELGKGMVSFIFLPGNSETAVSDPSKKYMYN